MKGGGLFRRREAIYFGEGGRFISAWEGDLFYLVGRDILYHRALYFPLRGGGTMAEFSPLQLSLCCTFLGNFYFAYYGSETSIT